MSGLAQLLVASLSAGCRFTGIAMTIWFAGVGLGHEQEPWWCMVLSVALCVATDDSE